MSLPIDVVEAVTVIANPYDPEYGRLAGAVSKVETTTSNFDDFHFTIQNLFPRPRKRDGDFIGLEAATPRATLTGPPVKHKVAFTESLEYKFIRTPVDSLPPLQRDTKFEGFTWFNQVDVNLTAQQSMTATFTLHPQKLNYLGLNTFTPQPSTPDLHQRGDMVSLQHRFAINSDSLLLSQVSYKRFDVDLTPNSTAPYDLLVEAAFARISEPSRIRSWSIALRQDGIHSNTTELIFLRLASQGIGYLTVLGPVASEPIKIRLLERYGGSATAATLVDTGLYWLSAALVLIAGGASAPSILAHNQTASLLLALIAGIGIFALLRRHSF